jgi:phosphatidylinositol alpha 1,6-mannosyltransferase
MRPVNHWTASGAAAPRRSPIDNRRSPGDDRMTPRSSPRLPDLRLTMTSMRVVIVTESFLPQVNGVTRTVAAFLEHLQRRGHEALVFAPGRGTVEHAGHRVVRVMGVTGLLYPGLTIAPVAPGMRRVLHRFAPDIVHLASPAALGVYARLAAHGAGVPVVAHYQTDLVAYAQDYGGRWLAAAVRGIERAFHNRCAATFAPTEVIAAELRRRGFDNVAVSGRGVDTARFRPGRPGALPAAARWPDGVGPRVLCVARLAREKRLDRLVDLALREPGLRVLLVGDGPCREVLSAAAPCNLALAGALEGDELADTYAAAEIFAFPSTTETFGQVVQEAMASGIPVVAVRAGGVAELVEDGGTGVLVEPPGLALPRAVAELARDPERCRRLGAAARRTVEGRDWSVVFDSLLERYQEVADRSVHRRSTVVRLPAGPPPRTRRAAAFFDVDRTVVRGSCFLALARPARRAGLVSARSVARAALHQLWFSARGYSDGRLARSARRAAAVLAGMEVAEVRRLGRRALATHVLPRVHPAALRTVEAHRRAGDLVFLVSAAPEELVGELAALLHADGFAGTRAETAAGRYTGTLLRVCHGEGKVRAVEELARSHAVDLGRSTAYSDSASDLGMLCLVGRPVCVNPDARLRAEARRRRWEIRRFRLGDTAGVAEADPPRLVAGAPVAATPLGGTRMASVTEVVERFNAAFNAKDWPSLAGLMADAIECVSFAGAIHRGVDENRAFHATWWNAFPDCRLTAHSLHVDGATVVEEGTFTGTHRGAFRTQVGDIPPTGRRVRAEYIEVLTVERGRVARQHLIVDRLDLLDQLGLTPSRAAS